MTNFTTSYAQNREDRILKGFLKNVKKGFYVDVGANHPIRDSVTKIFYDDGWHGINIEPNSFLLGLLKRQRPRDINLGVGVSDQPGRLKLREYKNEYSGLSTFSEQRMSDIDQSLDFEEKEVEVLPLKDIFKQHQVKKINFMKVDVEGFEHEVLSGNDWREFRPQIICIEANHITKDWHELLKKNKYSLVFFDGLNEYFIAQEAKKIAANFSYVEDMIGKIPLPHEYIDSMRKLEADNINLRNAVVAYRHDIAGLQFELAELRRVLPLVKQLVKSLDAAIRRRIDRLNYHKKDLPPKFSFDPSQDRETLMRSIRIYDMTANYKSRPTKDRLFYRLVFHAYNSFMTLSFRFAKTSFHFLRRIKVKP